MLCLALPCLDLNNIVRFVPASCATSVAQLVEYLVLRAECCGFESHLRQLIFL